MGFFGFSVFIVTIAVGFIICVAAYRSARREGNVDNAGVASVCIAFFIGTMGSFFGGDDLQGVVGLLFFMTVALASRILSDSDDRQAYPQHVSTQRPRIRTAPF